jgi:hypothetical protein
MALDLTRLWNVASVGQNNLWLYHTTDAHALVDTAGYFTNANLLGVMRVGDIIDVVVFASTAFAAISTYGRHIVNSNTGSAIDVSDVTVGTVTDTD